VPRALTRGSVLQTLSHRPAGAVVIIRPAQIEAFASPYTQDFEPGAMAHIQVAFPKHYGFLQDDGARAVIAHGRDRAREYGLGDRRSTLLYIDFTLLLGRSFDEDPQLPWAAAILNDPSLGRQKPLDVIHTEPPVRAVRLHEYATAYLDLVSGLDNEFIDEAQRRLLHESPAVRAPHTDEVFEKEVLERLRILWPEKYEYIGEAAAVALTRSGVHKMRGYGFSAPAGAFFGVVAMYMLGSGFDEDPLFSWATAAIRDGDGTEKERAERFYEKGMQYLKSWCALC
jgi:hypothetical protein